VKAASANAERPLTPAAVEILASVAQHRLLTTRQVRELRGSEASARWTLELLCELERRGALSHVMARGRRKLWHLTERGAELALASGLLERPPKLLGAAEATGALQEHTLAVNDAAICFLRAARERPGDDFGPLSWRHEVAHPLTRSRGRRRQLISDALLTYLVADGERLALEYRLLELDRASLSVDRLARKLARYAELARARDEQGRPAWRAWYPALPAVIAVLAGAEREALERRRRTVLALCRSEPELAAAPELELSICLLCELEREGPFAPIFFRPGKPTEPIDWLGRRGATPGREGGAR
jgi:hypothetical protein